MSTDRPDLFKALSGSSSGSDQSLEVDFSQQHPLQPQQSGNVTGLHGLPPTGGSEHLPTTLDDLRKSGLEPKDLRVRLLTPSERTACNMGMQSLGYVIPYFDLNGSPIPYYRVKICTPQFEANLKYKAPKKQPNHIYFPPGFKTTLQNWLDKNPHTRIVLITEGEKKASAAIKSGFPCVGLSGVDSWRSRTILLPSDTELYQGTERGKKIRAKLPAGNSAIPELLSLAIGFGSLVDCIVQYNLTPIVIFDSDEVGTLKSEVQRAATMLAYELRFLGIPSNRIKQIILPDLFPGEDIAMKVKVGLDDFLVAKGTSALTGLIGRVYNDPTAFPKHPNPKGYINSQMSNFMDRKEHHQIASIILSELDSRGLRLRE